MYLHGFFSHRCTNAWLHGSFLAENFHINLLMTLERENIKQKIHVLDWKRPLQSQPPGKLEHIARYSGLLPLCFQLWSSFLLTRQVILPYLPRKLIQARTSHCNINTEKVPVFRFDNQAVPWPNESSTSNSNLLRIRYLFRWLSKVSNVGNADTPFERWRPEMNGFGASGMVPKGLKLGSSHWNYCTVLWVISPPNSSAASLQ